MMTFTMPANTALSENKMVESAVSWLRDRLPQGWQVGPTSRAGFQTADGRIDAAIDVRGPNGTSNTLVVEAKRTIGPRDVGRLLPGLGRRIRALAGNVPVLVIAPWLSRRTRELLTDQDLNFLDLTGNARICLDNPTLFIETQGAAKDPSPPAPSKARVQGPKAGRFIRLLVDVSPPYGVRELAESAGLAVSYVSRVLDTLDGEALVERSKRGGVASVDVSGLLRRWAETYDVFRSNTTQRYLAPAGAGAALQQLVSVDIRAAVTGSFAESRLAPIAAPTLLAAYTDTPEAVADALGLIPADQGANVALLTPFDPVVWERTSIVDGITYVAPTQVAVDCLTGNGRMPAEGDAILKWMSGNESSWRIARLPKHMPND